MTPGQMYKVDLSPVAQRGTGVKSRHPGKVTRQVRQIPVDEGPGKDISQDLSDADCVFRALHKMASQDPKVWFHILPLLGVFVLRWQLGLDAGEAMPCDGPAFYKLADELGTNIVLVHKFGTKKYETKFSKAMEIHITVVGGDGEMLHATSAEPLVAPRDMAQNSLFFEGRCVGASKRPATEDASDAPGQGIKRGKMSEESSGDESSGDEYRAHLTERNLNTWGCTDAAVQDPSLKTKQRYVKKSQCHWSWPRTSWGAYCV